MLPPKSSIIPPKEEANISTNTRDLAQSQRKISVALISRGPEDRLFTSGDLLTPGPELLGELWVVCIRHDLLGISLLAVFQVRRLHPYKVFWICVSDMILLLSPVSDVTRHALGPIPWRPGSRAAISGVAVPSATDFIGSIFWVASTTSLGMWRQRLVLIAGRTSVRVCYEIGGGEENLLDDKRRR